ncbi:hypothetical protein GCM10010289_54580 [Streptomyces violascens]|uniref:Transposase n=1 Tax=Streptomyces violascens TaxID=67381 RepID=A0ABQ3QV96_9ACTN|nr:hypothetical protein GCM10010289_54580 [Streptomyces violascens]GHI41195.1 hypothetical protein Sviol_56030 [Streptomyces violascens]
MNTATGHIQILTPALAQIPSSRLGWVDEAGAAPGLRERPESEAMPFKRATLSSSWRLITRQDWRGDAAGSASGRALRTGIS